MRKKDLKDLRNQSVEELKNKLKNLKDELFKAKMDLTTKKVKNVHQVLNKRKEIAKILTIIKEKELLKEEK